MSNSNVPAGFRPYHAADGPFDANMVPLYYRRDEREFSLGLRLERKHCNYQSIFHGGAMATFVDLCLGGAVRNVSKDSVRTVTASLTIDYIGSAVVGDWVEATAKVLKLGRRLVFVECLVTAAGDAGAPKIITRSSGTYARVTMPDKLQKNNVFTSAVEP